MNVCVCVCVGGAFRIRDILQANAFRIGEIHFNFVVSKRNWDLLDDKLYLRMKIVMKLE